MAAAVVGATVLAWGGATAVALPVTLIDGSSVVTVDPESEQGLSAWTVNGVVHVREQGFWVRVGDTGPEASLAGLVLDSQLASDVDRDGHDETLVAMLADPLGRFGLELRWSVLGSRIGVGSTAASDIAVQIALTNLTDAPLAVSLFEYTDVDVLGSFADDVAEFSGTPPNTLRAGDASGLARYESVWTAAPGAVEAALFDDTLASLRDTAPTELDGTLAAAGDVTGTVQWDLRLEPGATRILSQDQGVDVLPVPESATSWLLGLAALRALRRRGVRA
ncbi:MAG: hypothetical protein QNK03_26345 [Myxococcota bacterium]|nr:hypothetical protein [Myxococcota bacterium]